MQKIYLLMFALYINFQGNSQDGKILEQRLYHIADTNVVKLRKVVSNIDTIITSVDFYSITYLSDGLRVKGFVAMPNQKRVYPCVIYNRGGNREFGAINDFALGTMLGVMANWGYIVIASQYRGNGGSEGKEEFGGRDINDVINLIPALSFIPGADTSRIGMYGWSRGGMMTYLALSKTNRIKAAVVGAGMADAFMTIKKRPEMETRVFAELIPRYQENRDTALRQRSAVYWPEKINKTTPLLILHGSADWRVAPEEALRLADLLYKVKHPLRFVLFEGGQHSLVEHTEEVRRLSKLFLDNYLRDRTPWPNLELHGN